MGPRKHVALSDLSPSTDFYYSLIIRTNKKICRWREDVSTIDQAENSCGETGATRSLHDIGYSPQERFDVKRLAENAVGQLLA
jgi:hypothetical protein